MHVEIGTEAAQFLFWEYKIKIFCSALQWGPIVVSNFPQLYESEYCMRQNSARESVGGQITWREYIGKTQRFFLSSNWLLPPPPPYLHRHASMREERPRENQGRSCGRYKGRCWNRSRRQQKQRWSLPIYLVYARFIQLEFSLGWTVNATNKVKAEGVLLYNYTLNFHCKSLGHDMY